jgi:hypothetical protein
MIWLTWRQQRLEALLGGALLALLALYLLVTGLDMASTYHRLDVAACLTSTAPACGAVTDAFRNQFGSVSVIANWLALLPLVFGVLLAAPFVLELEQGTYRLVWTQGITRTRWVTLKLGVVVTAALLIGLALAALLSWWRSPLDHLNGSFEPSTFDVEGTVPLAYTAFAVALVQGAGTLLRRTVPAMAISLVGFMAVRLAVEKLLRPSYAPPVVTALTSGGPGRTDWILGQYFRDRLGHQLDIVDVMRTCGVTTGQHVVGLTPSCLTQHDIVNVTTYQPGNRFWLFQGIETVIFLGLAVGLLALTVWWVRRRVA